MNATKRRRGHVLEQALLAVAWEQLKAAGYTAFTMDAVAAGAGTSKTVVYRRWRTRAELILATMRAHAPAPPIRSDTGALRTDTIAILQWLADRFRDHPDVMRGLMAELPDAGHPVAETSLAALRSAVGRAVDRREVAPGRITDLRIAVPLDILRYQMFVARKAATHQQIEEIVDDVFLPLVCGTMR